MDRRFRPAAVVGGLAVALVLTGCATTPKEPLLTQQERQLNMESFEQVWSTVNDEYWDPEFGGIDWRAVHDELRPQIKQANTMSAARGVLRDMISRLGLSHFGIFPAEIYKDLDQPQGDVAEAGATGLDVRVIDGHALVTSVVPGSPADQLGVRPGWEVIRVAEVDVVARLEKLTRELEDNLSKPLRLYAAIVPRMIGPPGDTLAVTFLDGDDRPVALDIPLVEQRGQAARYGNLGNIRVWIDVREVDDSIGYIVFNGFFNAPYLMQRFNDAMVSFMDADGLIIDLRGNGGGMGAMAMGMAGWLLPGDRHLGTLHTRDNELKLIAQSRPKTYGGPLVVLVDGLSGSASEFLSSGLQETGRACIVGSRTKGEVLPGEFKTLANGDVFLYAVANFILASGNTLEGIGVTPDIEVHHTRKALLAGRDLPVEAAIAWIRAQQ